ncbi:MAG: DICT sensory domain-containing protein [Leptolyngbyaceae bacterium]|nr:DICT sensory domain-containing protein [Leptolyngbyaceae bacterium]
MSIPTSVLEDLLQALPHLHPQIYFKASLTALSHAIEDQILAGSSEPLVIASFQRERFYRQEAHRYLRIAERTQQVYVLAAPETDFKNCSDHYETIAFDPTDRLSHEWHLVVIGAQYATCLVCREREALPQPLGKHGFANKSGKSSDLPAMDQVRRFEGIWTFDREVSCKVAELLLDRISIYRPELTPKIEQARTQFLTLLPGKTDSVDPDPFAERLVTYLQAGQYKLLKAYRSIAAQEQRERLVNSITTAIRQSLNPDDIFKVAVRELGASLKVSRCLIYRCKATDTKATIQYEFLGDPVQPLKGQVWSLQDNSLLQEVIQRRERIDIAAIEADPHITAAEEPSPLIELINRWQISAWLVAPVLYQGRLLGMVELHQSTPYRWIEEELALVDAIATQLGVALIQAEAYANLEDLNQQLEALDRTRSNLVAITGHELRTPLSTIQVCLESLVSEPDMPLELRQIMLDTALTDAERMRKLVQDFLTLSRLESGRVEWHVEPLPIQECIDLSLSNVRTRQRHHDLPNITAQVSSDLPLVKTDGEWLVEVLAKLMDNACKFTESTGKVTIEARTRGDRMIEVTVTDTGRGIEPNRLETVFERFYQEEGALRRTAGGTGLGLAICRQIITGLGGEIWAESAGRDQGSQFHFTLPIAEEPPEPPKPVSTKKKSKRSG